MSGGLFFLLVLGLAVYFIPTMVAIGHKKRNTDSIFVLNIFLGWTLIGWVVALVWATAKD